MIVENKEATPMIMPNIVKRVRSLCWRRFPKDWGTRRPKRAHQGAGERGREGGEEGEGEGKGDGGSGRSDSPDG